jgi:cation transport regulator ChaC
MPTRDPFFFGYGSLVNRDTHAFPHVARARVRGWARTWKRTRLRKVAFLTAVEAPGIEIEGLIAAVPDADWVALDAREYAYHRLPVLEIDHEHAPTRSTCRSTGPSPNTTRTGPRSIRSCSATSTR